MQPMQRRLCFVSRLARGLLAALAASSLPLSAATQAAPSKLPEIRLSDGNRVPRCVTPGRLMAFLKSRNPRPDPRFADIAQWYQRHGEAWRVRWDYAFFQMAIETNFLTYRRPDGRMGDVDPRQNNFAGIGTTGGGVPGDSYPDVKTGVLAQIQHLVAYSGERLAQPVAPRTQLKQNDIVAASRRLNRPVLFSDLARRWAVDPKYAASIAWIAEQFRAQHCPNPDVPPPEEAGARQQAKPRPAAAPAARATPARPLAAASVAMTAPAAGPAVADPIRPVAAAAARCLIQTASYGGQKTILIRHDKAEVTELTALTVLDGFETSMTESYLRARAPGGTQLGAFADQTSALARAREICPPA